MGRNEFPDLCHLVDGFSSVNSLESGLHYVTSVCLRYLLSTQLFLSSCKLLRIDFSTFFMGQSFLSTWIC